MCLAWQCPIQTIILEIMDLFWRRKGWYFLRCGRCESDIYGEFLSLNVDEDNSAIDFDLAIEAAHNTEISTEQAKKNVTAIRKTVADNWRSLAGKYGISRGEIERMCPAFQGDV